MTNDPSPQFIQLPSMCVSFHVIVVLTGSPDPSVVNDQILLASEFDRDDTLSNITSALRNYQRQSPLFTDNSVAADESVMVKRVILRNWPAILSQLIDLRNQLNEFNPVRVHHSSSFPKLLIFNMCDGTELDGYAGSSIPRDLERQNFVFTGSMFDFYHITTPKTFLKSILQSNQVPTSHYVQIFLDTLEQDVDDAINSIGFPLIVKPSISYASIGITSSSVTYCRESTINQAREVLTKYPYAGCFIEKFLEGREFTAVVTGDYKLGTVKVYPVAERSFRPDLDPSERFLAFDRYWEGWTIDGDRPPADSKELYEYILAPSNWQDLLAGVARDAYIACCGTGYGRVDIRTTNCNTCEPFVLEVNANCGLSFDNTSSLGEILRLTGTSPLTFLHEIILDATHRWISAMEMPKIKMDENHNAHNFVAASKLLPLNLMTNFTNRGTIVNVEE